MISIHASRGGSDVLRPPTFFFGKYFNPRFPWGKRRRLRFLGCLAEQFQSTLPVGEATGFAVQHFAVLLHFNPRFPWGKRLPAPAGRKILFRFQSTLPVGEATPIAKCPVNLVAISIHASRGGSDVLLAIWQPDSLDFNPRFPWGKRPEYFDTVADDLLISIHASRGGSDP